MIVIGLGPLSGSIVRTTISSAPAFRRAPVYASACAGVSHAPSGEDSIVSLVRPPCAVTARMQVTVLPAALSSAYRTTTRWAIVLKAIA